MKKILSVLLVLGLCCGLFAGCNKETGVSPNSKKNTPQMQEKESVEPVKEKDDDEEKNTAEEEQKLVKEREESLVTYADMISEIAKDIPELNVSYVVGNKTGGKDMSIHMDLLESKDATTHKMAELTATKETLLNNNGITDITIFVNNQEENVGIVMFENENGRFDPVVNTL